ncbi:hypothetical protein HYH02_009773 [Chlamydomonas schloesseri]|uniref:Uncharacterized protein n=1 Tax=Chlamydomonas schloesseri TaxID=2026947 RepID=A0A835TQ34_9CHLO|nr:hypothetical protein HYH02_009773 [Chlamydomonas schloesseri]|eukprot:KAG2441980.1 hypothetical protein HYH02_009773 [Chlamydomonas schloesseri]
MDGGGDGGGVGDGGNAADEADTPSLSPAWRERLPAGLEWKVQWQFGSAAGSASPGPTPPASGASGKAPPPAAAAGTGTGLPSAAAPDSFKWTRFDRGAAVRAAALSDSGWDTATFDSRLDDLAALLPDLRRRLPALPPAALLAALRDPRGVAAAVVTLKGELPGLDVSALLLCHPPFLDPTVWPPGRLAAGAAHAAAVLGGRAAAEAVLQWYPPLLDPQLLDGSLAQLRRLVPHLVARCLPPPPPPGLGLPTGSSMASPSTEEDAGAQAQQQGSYGGGGAGQPHGPGLRGRKEPDAKELVHLLGIVMKSTAGPEEAAEGGPAAWWEQGPGPI